MTEREQQSPDLVRAAAERGVAEAQSNFGQMHLDGRLVPRNTTLALHWFERAATGGDVMAMNMVGRCLDQGWGVAASQHLAAPWFRKAAEKGLDWGMYNLATLMILGKGVPEDREGALYWLLQASSLGHAKSINLIGGFYEDGWQVAQDLVAAKEWYLRSAEGGDFRGQFNYARLLIQQGDVDAAMPWLHRVPETATPAFLDKVCDFFSQSPHPAVRQFAQSLISQGVNKC